jgi:hypothetical protein
MLRGIMSTKRSPFQEPGNILICSRTYSGEGRSKFNRLQSGALYFCLEILTKPCFQSIKGLPLLAGRVLVCTIHEHSFTPRCFVESDSTDVAVRTAETQRWQTSLARPCLSYWDSVRPAQWDSLGDAATRAGMRLRHDVLAKAA